MNIPQGNATYDAATANMGYPWKMFTKDQGQELIDNTTSEWTTINGVNGRKFINKSDSNKYIFLPAGGVWSNTSNSDAGSHGAYWPASRYDASFAWTIELDSSSVDMYGNSPRYGKSVRPIKHPY